MLRSPWRVVCVNCGVCGVVGILSMVSCSYRWCMKSGMFVEGCR